MPLPGAPTTTAGHEAPAQMVGLPGVRSCARHAWVEGGEAWNPWTEFSPQDHTVMEQALSACPL